MGSLEFAKKLLADAKVAVSPGIGFGQYGDDHVRFALIENEARTRQALRGIKDMFRKDGLLQRRLRLASTPVGSARHHGNHAHHRRRARRCVEPEWLAPRGSGTSAVAPAVCRSDYVEQDAAQIFATGGEMCVAVDGDDVVGLAVFRSFENTHVGHASSTSTIW